MIWLPIVLEKKRNCLLITAIYNSRNYSIINKEKLFHNHWKKISDQKFMVRTFVGAAGDSLVLLVVLGRVWSQFEHGEAFVPARWSRISVVGRARRVTGLPRGVWTQVGRLVVACCRSHALLVTGRMSQIWLLLAESHA